MALETATYINQLNSSNPLSTDVVSQADDHLRLIKQTLLNTFPNITGPVTQTQAQMNQPIPTGIITMWSGTLVSIPSGWNLCDGANGTPDLRNKFIMGAGSVGYSAPGTTGGSSSITLSTANLPAHSHTITATMDSQGAHTHAVTDPGHAHTYTVVTGSGGIAIGGGYGQVSTSTGTAYTGISIQSAGAHTHTITASASSVGSGTPFDPRPPYYVLAFIMKA